MILMSCLMKYLMILLNSLKSMSGKINSSVLRIIILLMVLSSRVSGQEFPEKPFPPRLVNDFAGILQPHEVDALEQKLVDYNDSTSTQIAVVTLTDIHGYAIGDYSQRLAEKWGIGQKGLNNGVLILLKPKTSESSRGEVFIAPGYGLEGVIPDIICAQIIDNEMIPEFRNGNYYGGLDRATSTLMSLASGEFPPDQYGKKKDGDLSGAGPFVFIIIVILIILFLRGSGGSNNKNIGSKGLPLWMILAMMNSGRNSHSGSWGGFSGGGGSRGGGGFGGFGGGSFGGGGAGGSW
jgi:uncharacterized protein